MSAPGDPDPRDPLGLGLGHDHDHGAGGDAGTGPWPDDPAVDLVASAGMLDPVVALLRELLHVSRAFQAIAVVHDPDAIRAIAESGLPGDDALVADADTAIVDVERLNPIEITVGERVLHVPHSIELDATVPPLPEFRQLPPFDADPATGDVSAPLGGVEHYALATRAVAELLGPGDVLQLRWESQRPGVAFSITASASASEPIVLGVGDDTYPMPGGWPGTATIDPSSGGGSGGPV